MAMIVEIMFMATMLVYLWECTFEIIFGKTKYNFAIIVFSIVIYIVHIIFFNITEYANEKLELITDRSLIAEIYIKKKLIKDVIVLTTMAIQLIKL
jgi:magnesium-transporting ATPase (P-type)